MTVPSGAEAVEQAVGVARGFEHLESGGVGVGFGSGDGFGTVQATTQVGRARGAEPISAM